MSCPADHPGRVKLGTAAGSMEAEIIRSLLAGAGIPVQTRGEAVGRIYGLTAGPLAEVQIWVPAGFREVASRLLGEANIEQEE